jgi:hypothetical protein
MEGQPFLLTLRSTRSNRAVTSALDIFGGNLVKFQDLVEWNKTALLVAEA